MSRIKDFFDLEGPFMNFMEKLMWVFFINLLFILCSIPIVTIGPAAKAMYTVMFRLVEERKIDLFAEYFSAFIKNIFTSILLGLTSVVMLFIAALNILYFFLMGNTMGYILMGVSILIFLAILCIVLCMFPIYALNNGKYKETIISTLEFIKTYPGSAIAVLITTIGFVVAAILIVSVQIFYIFAYLLFIMIGLCALIVTYIIHKKLILAKLELEDDEEE